MISQNKVMSLIADLNSKIAHLFPGDIDVILFGSYARGDTGAALLLDQGVMLSPIIENRDYFYNNVDVLPFFSEIQREGTVLRTI